MLLSEQLQFNSMYLGQLIYLNISRKKSLDIFLGSTIGLKIMH